MKILKACAFVALLHAGYLQASAQAPLNEPDYNKPKIFTDLPAKIALRLTDAEALLTLSVGSAVNATLATGFTLSGTVVSKSAPSNNAVQSIVIKSNRQAATFTFTRIKNADGSISYRGRMLGKSAGDALEIIKEGTTYLLHKISYYDLINE